MSFLVGCDHGLVESPPNQTGIAGELLFSGEWPADIGEVAVGVYKKMPQTPADFFNIGGSDTGVEIGVSSYSYNLSVESEGDYEWLVVVWRKTDSFWDFSSLLGCYSARNDSLPSSIEVKRNQIVEGVHIEVDFSKFDQKRRPGSAPCERLLPSDLFADLGDGE